MTTEDPQPTSAQRPTIRLRLTPEELNARKRRNVWIAMALVGFIVLVFFTTALRMLSNQAEARKAEAEAQARAAAYAQPAAPAAAPTPSPAQ